MNYTQNYHLPQWVKEDRIMMEDFNAMNSSIESGLTTAVSTANSAAASASTAVQAANAAYSPDNKPYVTGTFTGNGGTQDITLGFRPSFLIIGCDQMSSSTAGQVGKISLTGGSVNTKRIILTDNGFTTVYGNGFDLPLINCKNTTYDFIAFQ